MREWTFYLETYGCKVNQYESEALREAWRRKGGREVGRPEEAGYIIINSCAITGRAERDSRNAVYRTKRLAPHAKIILAGCAAQFFTQFIPRKNANWAQPDIIVPQSDKNILADAFFVDGLEKDDREAREKISSTGILSYNRARVVVKIQDGCSQNCTYCIVPQTRGRPRSRAPRDILNECANLVQAGFCELVISGVNLRQYGRDRPEFGDFWDLLHFLDKELHSMFSGAVRLRISSLEPAQLTEKGLATLAQSILVCPHVHLSLQHASPGVLRRMGRGHYSMAMIATACNELRKRWPLLGLGADIIAGFPGETEDDLDILLDFMATLPLTYAHVFPYSRRQGTAAADYPEQIGKKIKHVRAERARELAGMLKRIFLEKLLGQEEITVVADGATTRDGAVKGISGNYAPCVLRGSRKPPKGFMRVRPLSVEGDVLLVEEMPVAASPALPGAAE